MVHTGNPQRSTEVPNYVSKVKQLQRLCGRVHLPLITLHTTKSECPFDPAQKYTLKLL